MGIHIKLFNDQQWAAAKAGLQNAGHDLVQAGETEVQKLEAIAIAKYPALVSEFKAAFQEVEHDDSVKGFAKMEKVVEGIIPQIPGIAGELADLTNLKDFLLSLGQTLFADTLATLETEAKKLLSSLIG